MTGICEVMSSMGKIKEKDKLFVVSCNTKCMGHQMELTEVMTRISKRRYFFVPHTRMLWMPKAYYRLKKKKKVEKLMEGKSLKSFKRQE